MPSPLHGFVDAFAIWTEDRKRRAPAAFRPRAPVPLDCFGPLSPLPPPPPEEGAWRAPSPRPVDGDGKMSVLARRARGVRRGTAILVPPWKVPGLGAVAGWARLVARQGLDVWTLVPPRHLDRAAPGTRSGEGFVSPDLAALAASLEQLVVEVRGLVQLARGRGGEVAVVGLSLGALAAALAAEAPDAPDAAALIAPPADLASVLAGTGIGRRYAALAARAGTPMPAESVLAPMLAPFRADARPRTAPRAFVAAGREDRIAPAADAIALARAWGVEPRLYPRGHLTLLFACRAVRRDLARFLSGG